MPLSRPSYTAIYGNLYTDMSVGLGTVPIARFSILGSLARALSRALDAVYGYVDGTFLNAVPWSARGPAQDAWAALWGITRMAPASASGSASFQFNAAAVLPAGSVFVAANTVSYTSNADVVATGAGTYSVSLGTTTTGTITNAVPGSVVTLSTPVANVVPTGTILTLTGGLDAETDASLFARAQQVRSGPPQGGSQLDMVEWALASNAVTRAWCQPTPIQPGTVIVYIMLDNNANQGFPIGTNGTANEDARGTAATGDQLITAEYIYAPYRRPVTAFVQVVAPVAQPINITLTNCKPALGTTTSPIYLAVVAALKARLLAIGSPLAMNVYESDLAQAVQSVLTSFNLTIPNAATAITIGNLPTLGTLTYS
jgi:uncharacterized phage protein gp47/JayE